MKEPPKIKLGFADESADASAETPKATPPPQASPPPSSQDSAPPKPSAETPPTPIKLNWQAPAGDDVTVKTTGEQRKPAAPPPSKPATSPIKLKLKQDDEPTAPTAHRAEPPAPPADDKPVVAEKPVADEPAVEAKQLAKAKSDTTKINLSEAHPPPKAKPPKPSEAAAQQPEPASKPEGSAPAEPDDEASGVQLAETMRIDASKSKTIRLDDIQEDSLEDLYQAALNATQRVILDDQQKAQLEGAPPKPLQSDTQTLKKAEIAQSAKKSTARLDLQEMLSEDDKRKLLKKETMHISTDSAAPAKPPSGTMKIQRPADEEPSSGATMAIPPIDLEESRKSETARIDLPREIASSTPPTQRKTIRIKRPDGTAMSATRAPLSVARATSSTAPKTSAGEEESPKAALKVASASESAHPAFAAVAIIAVLLSLAVVYVLAATLAPGVPFPGRLV